MSGVPGSELSEMLHHCSWAYEKLSHYVGCEEMVQKAIKIIFRKESRERRSSKLSSNLWSLFFPPLSGIKLCVIGKSGMNQ